MWLVDGQVDGVDVEVTPIPTGIGANLPGYREVTFPDGRVLTACVDCGWIRTRAAVMEHRREEHSSTGRRRRGRPPANAVALEAVMGLPLQHVLEMAVVASQVEENLEAGVAQQVARATRDLEHDLARVTADRDRLAAELQEKTTELRTVKAQLRRFRTTLARLNEVED
jgi:hypothetical protein